MVALFTTLVPNLMLYFWTLPRQLQQN